MVDKRPTYCIPRETHAVHGILIRMEMVRNGRKPNSYMCEVIWTRRKPDGPREEHMKQYLPLVSCLHIRKAT